MQPTIRLRRHLMRALLSIPVALVLAVAIHLDWHLARQHDHGGLSLHYPHHWVLALPLFALTAWYLARRKAEPALAGAVTIAVAMLLGQGVEPLGEYVAYGEPFSETFGPERLGAFAAFMLAGIPTWAVVTWLLRQRPPQRDSVSSGF